jgi:hypothetical protein
MKPALEQRPMPTPVALPDTQLDWGLVDQRLAARNRQVQRWALRAQFAILAAAALMGAIAAPTAIYDIALGLLRGIPQ